MMRPATLALAVLLLAGCTAGDDGPARLACHRFADVSNDAAAGLLTDGEVRDGLQHVHEAARHADDPAVADNAAAALAAITAGDLDELTDRNGALTRACDRHL